MSHNGPCFALCVALALGIGCRTLEQDRESRPIPSPFAYTTLATPDQIWLEKKLIQVLASPEVVEQRRLANEIYRSDPQARHADGQHTLSAALDSITAAMAQWAVNDDPSRPRFMWTNQAAHEWFGLRVPQAGYGIENPDNVYRHALIDGQSDYVIEGIMRAPMASQQSFTLYSTLPGTTDMNPEGSPIIGALSDVKTDAKGRFSVTIDPRPKGNRTNHIQSKPQTAIVIVRDSLKDWSRENASELTIRRVAGPAPESPPSDRVMAQRTASLMAKVIPFWVEYDNRYIYNDPPNTIPTPRIRAGGWGYSCSGHFALGENEVFVVTLSARGASYLGFQLADPWGVALPYVDRNGSLSGGQSRPNPDGSFTFVVAAQDPGVHNWVDTAGLGRGIFAIRWQDLDASPASMEGAIIDTRVVPASELADALPADVPMLTPIARTREQAIRAASYARRLE